MVDEIKILDVNITNESKDNILEYLLDRLEKSKEKTFIITPNPEMLVYASKHSDYKDKLNSSTIALPDGTGLFLVSIFMGKPLKERIPGVDFIEDLCKISRDKPLSMGFLGGKAGVAKRAAERLLKKYPYLNIVFVGSDWNQDGFRLKKKNQANKSSNNSSILNSQLSTPIDILFVAYGVPKQEEWISENLHVLPVKAAMGVGGSFDFISGNVARAPFLVRLFGFEWLFRLIVQPWRWKRQLALIEFIVLVFKEKFGK